MANNQARTRHTERAKVLPHLTVNVFVVGAVGDELFADSAVAGAGAVTSLEEKEETSGQTTTAILGSTRTLPATRRWGRRTSRASAGTPSQRVPGADEGAGGAPGTGETRPGGRGRFPNPEADSERDSGGGDYSASGCRSPPAPRPSRHPSHPRHRHQPRGASGTLKWNQSKTC